MLRREFVEAAFLTPGNALRALRAFFVPQGFAPICLCKLDIGVFKTLGLSDEIKEGTISVFCFIYKVFGRLRFALDGGDIKGRQEEIMRTLPEEFTQQDAKGALSKCLACTVVQPREQLARNSGESREVLRLLKLILEQP